MSKDEVTLQYLTLISLIWNNVINFLHNQKFFKGNLFNKHKAGANVSNNSSNKSSNCLMICLMNISMFDEIQFSICVNSSNKPSKDPPTTMFCTQRSDYLTFVWWNLTQMRQTAIKRKEFVWWTHFVWWKVWPLGSLETQI